MPIKMSFAYDADKLPIYELTHLIQAFCIVNLALFIVSWM